MSSVVTNRQPALSVGFVTVGEWVVVVGHGSPMNALEHNG